MSKDPAKSAVAQDPEAWTTEIRSHFLWILEDPAKSAVAQDPEA